MRRWKATDGTDMERVVVFTGWELGRDERWYLSVVIGRSAATEFDLHLLLHVLQNDLLHSFIIFSSFSFFFGGFGFDGSSTTFSGNGIAFNRSGGTFRDSVSGRSVGVFSGGVGRC